MRAGTLSEAAPQDMILDDLVEKAQNDGEYQSLRMLVVEGFPHNRK